MSVVKEQLAIWSEVAELFASLPTREEILSFRPSATVQERASVLLQRNKDDELTSDELEELDQFQHAETLMRLVKARLRSRTVT